MQIGDTRIDNSTSVVGLSIRKDLNEAINGAISEFAIKGSKINPAEIACHLHNYTVSEIEGQVIATLANMTIARDYRGADLAALLRMKRRESIISQIEDFMKEPDIKKIINEVDRQLLLLQGKEILKVQSDYTQEIDPRRLLELIFDHEDMLAEYLARE